LNLILILVRQRTFVIIRLREITHIEEPAAPLRLLSPGFGYLAFSDGRAKAIRR
jgi:hypothetical protein